MINLFPPGGVSRSEGYDRDNMTLEQAQEARERKLRDYFEDGELPGEHEKLFVAFAESYFDGTHLDEVALYHNFYEWSQMKEAILAVQFQVPDINTPQGYSAARTLLLEGNSRS